MKILIVDDQQERHDSAEKHLTAAGHTLLHSYDAEEALAVIQGCQDRIGLALLDHDLGVGMTGSGLATQWLQLEEDKYPAHVIVISQNPDGSLNIVSKFESAGIHVRQWPYHENLMRDIAVLVQEQ